MNHAGTETSRQAGGAVSKIARLARRLFLLFFALTLANFGAFMVGHLVIGGTGISGKVEDGRHYLGYKEWLIEVSEATYTYSSLHTLSVFCTFPLAILLGIAGALLEGHLSRRADTTDESSP